MWSIRPHEQTIHYSRCPEFNDEDLRVPPPGFSTANAYERVVVIDPLEVDPSSLEWTDPARPQKWWGTFFQLRLEGFPSGQQLFGA